MIYINKYWAKQPFSAAEKQWRYRTWRDGNPERRERYLEKGLEKYREDLQLGSKKRINELSEGEKRRQCKKCRETYHDIKSRKEALVYLVTPPDSPQLSPVQSMTCDQFMKIIKCQRKCHKCQKVSFKKKKRKTCKWGSSVYVVLSKCCATAKFRI